jgi:hypothetical protein
MRILRTDISAAFDDLLFGGRTKEALAEWATS